MKIQNTTPTSLPLYKVGDVHLGIGCSASGWRLSPSIIQGIVWWKDAWRYVTDANLTTYKSKDCGELACDDPCCDSIVISSWIHESMVNIDPVLAEEKAKAFFERSQQRRQCLAEGKIKIIDKRYHK